MKKANNYIIRTGWAVILLLFMLPAVVFGQGQEPEVTGVNQDRIEELQSRAMNRGYSEEQLAMILEPAQQMAGQNLPTELLFQKAMEGIAKGVPAQQMATVLQNIQRGTEAMVPVISQWVERNEVSQMLERSEERFDRELLSQEMLKVSSKAISQQVGPELVQDILNTLTEQGIIQNSRPSSVIAAIGIMPDIQSIGEQPDIAKGVLVRAVQSGFSASEMQRLPGAMNMAQRRSQLPAAAVIEGASQQMQGGVPAAEILQNLFNGNVGGGPPGNIPRGLENRPNRGQGNRGGN
jgi:hypothetical protein